MESNITKKALVISLGARSTAENYGAVLQMTAFCELLKKIYKISPTILDYMGVNTRKCRSRIVVLDCLFDRSLKGIIRRLLLGLPIALRYKKNMKFLKCSNAMTKLYRYDDIEKDIFDYDYYIAESDVIWDPTFRAGGFDKVFFLNVKNFLKGKKLVYAAGLGNANYTIAEKQMFNKFTTQIDDCSVRELYSKDFLEQFAEKKNIVCVLDPTLMVPKDYYRQFIHNRLIKKDYVLVYSPAFNNKKMIEDAYDYAKRRQLKVIIVRREITRYHFWDNKINVSVEDFLNYLYFSTAFFCDSYHGICLSVQLEKQFFVYQRDDGRKVEDICKRLGLLNRIVADRIEESPINYAHVNALLDVERLLSYRYLDRCLKCGNS